MVTFQHRDSQRIRKTKMHQMNQGTSIRMSFAVPCPTSALAKLGGCNTSRSKANSITSCFLVQRHFLVRLGFAPSWIYVLSSENVHRLTG